MQNNNKNLSQEQVNKLLDMASKTIGTQPSKLRSQLENGSIENVIKGLDPNQAKQLKNALSNPFIAQKLLNSKKAQQIINNLSKEK